jgi:hypothetical protein
MLYGGMTMSTLYLGGVVGELHLMSARLQSNSQHFRCLDQLLRLSERECHLSAFKRIYRLRFLADLRRRR